MSSTQGPGNIASRRGPATVCKTCGESVFVGQPTKWVRSPVPGLSHRDCTSPTSNEKT